MSINKVMLLGRLGQDPELKHTPTGMAVANFSVATSENWKDKTTGEKQEKTEWSRVVAWGKLAEICGQYLKKGSQAFVEGKLQTRQWENKEGVKMYTTEIVASNVQFISTQASTSTQSDNTQTPGPSDDANFAPDDSGF